LVVCIFEELQALKQAVMATVVTSLIRIVAPKRTIAPYYSHAKMSPTE
jgi:hypothetical protein